jgi:hypothetical protein
MPAEAIEHYLALADLCFSPGKADGKTLYALAAFVAEHRQLGTLRNRDTLSRMEEAIQGLRGVGVRR